MQIIATEIYSTLYQFFNWDCEKVDLWMNTRNPLLGNQIPIEMVLIGRHEKLLDFIESQIEGKYP